MFNLPVLFVTNDDTRDIKIGKLNTIDTSALPVPFPPELDDEFSGGIEVRNVDIYKTDMFTVKSYAEAILFSVDPSETQ